MAQKFRVIPSRVKFTFLRKKESHKTKIINLEQYLSVMDKFKPRMERYQKTGDIDLKANAPVIIPASIMKGGHHADYWERLTGYASFDLDDLGGRTVEEAKEELAEIPYVIFIMTSISGKGLWGLVRFLTNSYLYHYNALIEDMRKRGFVLDASGGNVNRLRFCSFDEDYYLAQEGQVFRDMRQDGFYASKDGLNLDYWVQYDQWDLTPGDRYQIKKFNRSYDCEQILDSAGWEFVFTDRRDRHHYLRPGGTSTHQYSGHIFGDKFWCWTYNAPPLRGSSINTPFDLITAFQFGGNPKKAITKIKHW